MSKGLETLEKLENDEYYTDYEYRVAYDVIRKELKALEIIREDKQLIKFILNRVLTYGLHNVENYDLLKEVLL